MKVWVKWKLGIIIFALVLAGLYLLFTKMHEMEEQKKYEEMKKSSTISQEQLKEMIEEQKELRRRN